MKIRIGTFNLFQFVEPPYSWYTKKEKFTQEEWEEKKAWIKEQITQMDCDIIGFQEVFSKKANTSLLVAAILKSYSAATCLINFTQPKSPSTEVIGVLPRDANS